MRTRTSRRSFLQYVGYGAVAPALGPLARAVANGLAPFSAFTPVAYPIPVPGDGGDAASDAMRLAKYTVRDELILPEGYSYNVIAAWGDRFGDIAVGHNCDYTGLIPIKDAPGEFFLIINHEYISARPWLQSYNAGTPRIDIRVMPDNPDTNPDGRLQIDGMEFDTSEIDYMEYVEPEQFKGQNDDARIALLAKESKLPAKLFESLRDMARAAFADLGICVLHVRINKFGRFEVAGASKRHLRFTGPSDSRKRHEMTGPAKELITAPNGTFSNCSGATTPWGTFLSCEENFQDQLPDQITPDGATMGSKPFKGQIGYAEHSLPFEFEGLGQASLLDIDPRGYGWVCEVDPVKGTLVKHTALGRFRHENVAIRAEKGRKLVAYMGDDRRGGHVWKFVSEEIVNDPADAANTKLLEKGTLYAAKFDKDFNGQWIALTPATKLVKPEPEMMASGHLYLPDRPIGGRISVATAGSKYTETSPRRWIAGIERFCEKKFDQCTLGDLVKDADAQAVLLLDAYAFANAAGATPASRPEDIEIHPADQSVYVTFTDSTGSLDGSPDVRIFPDSRGKNSRQYGAIFRIVENDNDPAATTFKWGKFVSSGEAHEGGGGFACADNMLFDPAGNLWIVCDMTTNTHNLPVLRDELNKTNPGGKDFMGVFGNNAMFMIPTKGPGAGVPKCFAIGPMECELTGPTFTPNGGLILAIQHPGESHGTRGHWASSLAPEVTRQTKIAARDGKVFTQKRTVPLGSNFPGGHAGDIPRSCVVFIHKA